MTTVISDQQNRFLKMPQLSPCLAISPPCMVFLAPDLTQLCCLAVVGAWGPGLYFYSLTVVFVLFGSCICVVSQWVGAWGPVSGAPTGQTFRLPALVAVGQLSGEQQAVSSSFQAEQFHASARPTSVRSTSAQLVLWCALL